MRTPTLLVALAIGVAAFAAGILVGRVTAPSAAGSGITGKVILIAQFGTDQASFPQRACQRVFPTKNGYDVSGSAVARFCSAKSGTYRVSVPPGRYLIVADDEANASMTVGLLKPVGPVVVRPESYTAQDVYYDNGGA